MGAAVVQIAALLVISSMAMPVQMPAIDICGPRETLAKGLKERYAEEQVSRGISNNGSLLELFASFGGGTWTLVETLPTGMSCAISAGHSWYQKPYSRKASR